MRVIFFKYYVLIMCFCISNLFAIEVTGWVPYYSQNTCYNNLQKKYGDVDPADVFTTIGLQFWRPTSGGEIEVVGGCEPYIDKFVTWGKENNIKIFLTVFNYSGGWKWSIAEEAFANNKDVFVKNLIEQMEKYDLDGVDLDLEGVGNLKDKNGLYADFVLSLSKELKKRGKLLAIDTYSENSYGGPNVSWWDDWQGQVDFIRPMIYQEGNYYSWLKDQGPEGSEVTMGMPAWVDSWASKTAVQNLQMCLDLNVGVALWDLQLQGDAWRSDAVWAKMLEIRQSGGADKFSLSVVNSGSGSISQNPVGEDFEEGTTVTLKAIPEDDFQFVGWIGDTVCADAEMILTMNRDWYVKAQFELDSTIISFDMLTKGKWETDADQIGSDIQIDKSDNSLSADFTLATYQSGSGWPWFSALVTADGEYDSLKAIDITYTASKDLQLMLKQPGLSENGEAYFFSLKSAEQPQKIQIATSMFKQGAWVSQKSPLELSKVTGVEFGAGFSPSSQSDIKGDFSITELNVRGVDFQMIPNIGSLKTGIPTTVSIKHQDNKLVIRNNNLYKKATLVSLSGRHIKSFSFNDNGSDLTIDVSSFAHQVILVLLENELGIVRSTPLVIK